MSQETYDILANKEVIAVNQGTLLFLLPRASGIQRVFMALVGLIFLGIQMLWASRGRR
jgi:hypothetical protein